MSSYRRSRRGRCLPVVGYVGVCGVCVCLLWAGASGIINSLLGYDNATTMKPREPSPTSQNMLQKTVTAVTTSNTNSFLETLNNILVPRVVGTPSHSKVKEYIIGQLKKFGWTVTSDSFTNQTPNFGPLVFENIIGRLNPSAKQYVVLACHYDSKYFPNMEFLGASDSAVPCAMLLNLAECLQENLHKLKHSDLSLELWFFDGEEAFVNWGPDDSLYGARHLAKKMEHENTLSKVKCLVLLDLLGPSNPVMYNYYDEQELYKHLVASEKALRIGHYLKGSHSLQNIFFKSQQIGHYVEDDHTPFLQRNVPVIHWIPSRFPDVWHTSSDNFDAVDMVTVEDMNTILRLFILRYYNL